MIYRFISLSYRDARKQVCKSLEKKSSQNKHKKAEKPWTPVLVRWWTKAWSMVANLNMPNNWELDQWWTKAWSLCYCGWSSDREEKVLDKVKRTSVLESTEHRIVKFNTSDNLEFIQWWNQNKYCVLNYKIVWPIDVSHICNKHKWHGRVCNGWFNGYHSSYGLVIPKI